MVSYRVTGVSGLSTSMTGSSYLARVNARMWGAVMREAWSIKCMCDMVYRSGLQIKHKDILAMQGQDWIDLGDYLWHHLNPGNVPSARLAAASARVLSLIGQRGITYSNIGGKDAK